MAYGTMGGEGQPQTQAAVFSRHVWHGMDLQDAISAPRWLLGRTWGEDSTTLKIEDGFAPEIYAALAAAGHQVERVGPLTAMMGHAGAIVRHADGRLMARPIRAATGAWRHGERWWTSRRGALRGAGPCALFRHGRRALSRLAFPGTPRQRGASGGVDGRCRDGDAHRRRGQPDRAL
jgi:hypothetical protein